MRWDGRGLAEVDCVGLNDWSYSFDGMTLVSPLCGCITELKQPRRRCQERHKFGYLTKRNNSVPRFACAFSLHVHVRYRPFHGVKWPVFPLCRRREHLKTILQFCLISETLIQIIINPRMLKTHFASVITVNNWEIIAETWSFICRWRCRCPRPLLKLFINAMHHTRTDLVPSAAALLWCIATYRQVLTTAFMSCRLVDRPTFGGWSPVCIDAASCNSMICWAA